MDPLILKTISELHCYDASLVRDLHEQLHFFIRRSHFKTDSNKINDLSRTLKLLGIQLRYYPMICDEEDSDPSIEYGPLPSLNARPRSNNLTFISDDLIVVTDDFNVYQCPLKSTDIDYRIHMTRKEKKKFEKSYSEYLERKYQTETNMDDETKRTEITEITRGQAKFRRRNIQRYVKAKKVLNTSRIYDFTYNPSTSGYYYICETNIECVTNSETLCNSQFKKFGWTFCISNMVRRPMDCGIAPFRNGILLATCDGLFYIYESLPYEETSNSAFSIYIEKIVTFSIPTTDEIVHISIQPDFGGDVIVNFYIIGFRGQLSGIGGILISVDTSRYMEKQRGDPNVMTLVYSDTRSHGQRDSRSPRPYILPSLDILTSPDQCSIRSHLLIPRYMGHPDPHDGILSRSQCVADYTPDMNDPSLRPSMGFIRPYYHCLGADPYGSLYIIDYMSKKNIHLRRIENMCKTKRVYSFETHHMTSQASRTQMETLVAVRCSFAPLTNTKCNSSLIFIQSIPMECILTIQRYMETELQM